MIVYFSGTGNSRYCARILAEELGDSCMDSFHFIRDGIAAELASEKPWVFVAPTYGWQLPRVFVEFLRSGSFAGSREAYFVMTCGSDTGSAAARNRELCRELGLCYRGTLPVVMPENYIALFRAPAPEKARRIVAAARLLLHRRAKCIREGRDFPEGKAGPLDRLKSGPVNRLFYRFYIKAGPFAATDACTGCGRCRELCPLGNICLEGGKPVWGDRCTHCMACICLCPAEAIEYGRISRGKRRYRGPEQPE